MVQVIDVIGITESVIAGITRAFPPPGVTSKEIGMVGFQAGWSETQRLPSFGWLRFIGKITFSRKEQELLFLVVNVERGDGVGLFLSPNSGNVRLGFVNTEAGVLVSYSGTIVPYTFPLDSPLHIALDYNLAGSLYEAKINGETVISVSQKWIDTADHFVIRCLIAYPGTEIMTKDKWIEWGTKTISRFPWVPVLVVGGIIGAIVLGSRKAKRG